MNGLTGINALVQFVDEFIPQFAPCVDGPYSLVAIDDEYKHGLTVPKTCTPNPKYSYARSTEYP